MNERSFLEAMNPREVLTRGGMLCPGVTPMKASCYGPMLRRLWVYFFLTENGDFNAVVRPDNRRVLGGR